MVAEARLDALNKENALQRIRCLSCSYIARDGFDDKGDQDFTVSGAIGRCVGAVKRFQVAGVVRSLITFPT